MLLKERNLALRQGLHATLSTRWCITSENAIKMFDPTVEPFGPMEQTMNETLATTKTNLEPQHQQIKESKDKKSQEKHTTTQPETFNTKEQKELQHKGQNNQWTTVIGRKKIKENKKILTTACNTNRTLNITRRRFLKHTK